MKYNLNAGDNVEILSVEQTDDNFPSVLVKNKKGEVYFCEIKCKCSPAMSEFVTSEVQ